MSPVVRWAEAVAAPSNRTDATMTPTPQRDCDMKVAPFEVGRCDVKVSAFVGPGGGVVKSYAQGKKSVRARGQKSGERGKRAGQAGWTGKAGATFPPLPP